MEAIGVLIVVAIGWWLFWYLVGAGAKTVKAAAKSAVGSGSFSDNMSLEFKGMGPFEVRKIEGRLGDSGDGLRTIEIEGRGIIPVSRRTRIGFMTSVFDSTGEDYRPIISLIEDFQEPGTTAYQHVIEAATAGPDEGYASWVRVGIVLPDILLPPEGGKRQLTVALRIIDMDNPPQIELGFGDSDRRVRFSGDVPSATTASDPRYETRLTNYFAQSGLQITSALSPPLYAIFSRVLSRLKIPEGSASAFVYADPDTQAACFAGSRSKCVIRLSSGMVKLMDEEELAFVVGHELGHFLLGHGMREQSKDQGSIEFFMQQRCQEISVDRIGLLACKSLEVAARALMKTASGLPSDLLRFDVNSFISQLRHTSAEDFYYDETETHPSLVVRCRALLWFSMSEIYSDGNPEHSDGQLQKIDERIHRDLERFVDGPARERIVDARQNVRIWLTAFAAVRDGVLKKREQDLIKELVGEDNLSRLANMYDGRTKQDALNLTKGKLSAALEDYCTLAPRDFRQSIPNLEREIGSAFGQEDFADIVKNLRVL